LNRLEENLGAADIELTPDDLREIERAFSGTVGSASKTSIVAASRYWPLPAAAAS
jgi:diketogulonate reductase-like aldo/keto reductase